jgi:hypothetical protein
LPLNLVQAGFQQIAKLKKADPKVNLTNRNVTTCHNPTFVAGHLSQNHLAQIAPMPAACDKQGAGPCGTDTGTNQPSTDGNQPAGTTSSAGPTAGSSSGPGGPGGPGAPTGADAPPTDPAQQGGDPATGAVVTADGGSAAVYANATTLVSDRPAQDRAFGWLAALELVALVMVPGVYVVARARRQRGER